MKICSNPQCPKDNPQPFSKFSKEPKSKDGYAYLCTYCRNFKAKQRRKLKEILKSLNNDEKNTTIACLYITGIESIKRISNLFSISENNVIEILKSEDLFEYIICKGCNRLKKYSEYSVLSHSKSSKGIQTLCKKCTAEVHREWSKNYVNYNIYAPKLEKYEQIRDDGNNILEAKCNYCGVWFKPLRSSVDLRVNTIIGYEQKKFSESRLYCSDNCKKVCPIYRKTAERLMLEDMIRAGRISIKELNREVQPELRQLVFERDNYTCRKCGKSSHELCVGLHCHHIEGILWNPLESADIDQCLTVCVDCHLKIHQKNDCRYVDMKCSPQSM